MRSNELVVQSVVPATIQVEPQEEREYVVLARCRLKVGDICFIYYPFHHDPESYAQHLNLHNQSARIIALNKKSVDIEVLSGSWKGKIDRDIRPDNLYFHGPYRLIPQE